MMDKNHIRKTPARKTSAKKISARKISLRRKTARHVTKCINEFHENNIKKLEKIKLDNLLQRGNLYLSKVKCLESASDLICELLRNRLMHSGETSFGIFLEELAIFICNEIYSATKSGIEGVDFEFSRNGIRYLVSVKSSRNWGNSNGTKKQRELFDRAVKTILKNKSIKRENLRVVLGCCFGYTSNQTKNRIDYYCGQEFWNFVSKDEHLYLSIEKSLGHDASNHRKRFESKHKKILRQLTKEFIKRFCNPNETINWNALIKFNSEHKR